MLSKIILLWLTMFGLAISQTLGASVDPFKDNKNPITGLYEARRQHVDPTREPAVIIAHALLQLVAKVWLADPPEYPYTGDLMKDDVYPRIHIGIIVYRPSIVRQSMNAHVQGFIGIAIMRRLLNLGADHDMWVVPNLDFYMANKQIIYGSFYMLNGTTGMSTVGNGQTASSAYNQTAFAPYNEPEASSDISNQSLTSSGDVSLPDLFNNSSSVLNNESSSTSNNQSTTSLGVDEDPLPLIYSDFQPRKAIPIVTFIKLIYLALKDFVWIRPAMRPINKSINLNREIRASAADGQVLVLTFLAGGQGSYKNRYRDIERSLRGILADREKFTPAQFQVFVRYDVRDPAKAVKFESPFLQIKILDEADAPNQGPFVVDSTAPTLDSGISQAGNTGHEKIEVY